MVHPSAPEACWVSWVSPGLGVGAQRGSQGVGVQGSVLLTLDAGHVLTRACGLGRPLPHPSTI